MTKHHDTRAWVKENDNLSSKTQKILEFAGLPKQHFKKFIGPTDFYMSAKEALDYGVIDKIL